MYKIVYVYTIFLDTPLDAKVLDNLLEKLPKIMQNEILHYKKWQDMQASILGKNLLLFALQKLKLNFNLNHLQQTQKGKLFFDNSIDFNISHSGNFIVLAITKNAQIGIDIEKHRPLDYLQFNKYFTTQEFEKITQNSNPLKQFFNFWSIKESAIKCNGNGMSILKNTEIINDNCIQIHNEIYYYKPIFINENYATSVCCNYEIEEINIQEVCLPNLL